MVQFCNSIETAVADHSEAMESRGHFKNGASSKSLMSRGNNTIKGIKIKGFYYILFIFFIGCSQNHVEKYMISGSISKEYNGKTVMLFTLLNDSIISVDSTIIKNGVFKFQGKEYIRDFSKITTKNFPDKVFSTQLILERGKINVYLDSISTVSGPLLNPLYQCYQDSSLLLYRNAYKLIEKALEEGTTNEITNDTAFLRISKLGTDYKLRVIKRNPNNAIGKRAFLGGYSLVPDKHLDECFSWFDELTQSDPKIKDYIKERRREMEKRERREKLLGTVIQDFELTEIGGKTKRISDYVGKSKYLYIDFWASWCGPCIAEFPDLIKIYNEYNKKCLNILGISFDTSEAAWKKALDTHHVNWEMVIAKNEKEMRDAYLISGIPFGILLDDKGTIVEIVDLGSLVLPSLMKKLCHH